MFAFDDEDNDVGVGIEEVEIVTCHLNRRMTGLDELLFDGEVLADEDVGVAWGLRVLKHF